MSLYEQKWVDFDVKSAKFPLFKVVLRKFHRKRWETAQKKPASEASRKFFCRCASILLLKNRFSSVFLWLSDFFQELRRGARAPPVSAPGCCTAWFNESPCSFSCFRNICSLHSNPSLGKIYLALALVLMLWRLFISGNCSLRHPAGEVFSTTLPTHSGKPTSGVGASASPSQRFGEIEHGGVSRASWNCNKAKRALLYARLDLIHFHICKTKKFHSPSIIDVEDNCLCKFCNESASHYHHRVCPFL